MTEPSDAGKYLKLPSNKACIGRSKMKIHMREPSGDPFKTISVGLKSGKIHRRAKLKRGHGKVTATLNLKGLIARTFKVKVHLTTVLGASFSAQRTYRRCVMSPAHKKSR